jgi:pyruvate dehydrogenase E1 component alpha subunit
VADDPIPRFEKRLAEEGSISQSELDTIKAEITEEIEQAVLFAEESPEPALDVLFEDLYV